MSRLPFVALLRECVGRLRDRYTRRTADGDADAPETSDAGEPAVEADPLRDAGERLQYSSDVSESDIETVRAALESENPDDRHRATGALAGVSSSSRSRVAPLIPVLVERLDDEQLSVRRNSATALGRIAATDRATVREHAPELVEHLSAYNVRVSNGVASALGEAAREFPEEVASLVFPYLDSDTHRVRHNAVRVLQNAADASPAAVEPVIPDLVDLLDRQSSDLDEILDVLATVADESPALVVPVVTELLPHATDGTAEERAITVGILSNVAVADPAAVRSAAPTLTRHLTEESPVRPESAARAVVAVVSCCPDERQAVLDALAEAEKMGTWRAARRLNDTGTDVGRDLAETALADSSLRQFLDDVSR